MAYRMNPVEDVQLVPHRGQGHGPKREHDRRGRFDAADGRDDERRTCRRSRCRSRNTWSARRAIWEELGFEPLRPQPPWFGYSLGDWLPQWDEAAARAAAGRYLENGRISQKAKRKGIMPETKYRPGE